MESRGGGVRFPEAAMPLRREPRNGHAVNSSSIRRTSKEIVIVGRARRPVDAEARHPEQHALPTDRERTACCDR